VQEFTAIRDDAGRRRAVARGECVAAVEETAAAIPHNQNISPTMTPRFAIPRLATAATLVVSLLLAACANAPVAMTASVRDQVHTVSVDPAVTLPPDMYYQGPGQTGLMMLGIVGALASQSSAATPKARLHAVMDEHHISVQEILAAEFAKQANAASTMKFVVGTEPADARVSLVVNLYGIVQSQGFGTTLYPTFNITATMTRADGTVLWKDTDFLTALNSDNKEGHTIEEYLKDPELIRKAFTSGGDLTTHMLAVNLAGSSK
jgi:hypothetical protein